MADIWIYHERQEALLCGQHALNNLVQAAMFTPDSLAIIAHQLDEMELNYMAQNDEGGVNSKDYIKRVQEGSCNVDEMGNFSIEVLRSALMNTYNLSLPNIRQEGVMGGGKDVTDIDGFICNKEAHWFAIRKINGRYWDLNSTKERPEIISHFNLAMTLKQLQEKGYSVFCVTDQLPPICDSADMRSRGLPEYWWKEADLVKGKTEATTAATDPWKDTGSGMRLDGRSTTGTATSTAINGGGKDLSEEDQLQQAISASLKQAVPKVAVTVEPTEDDPNAVRIQFRMPDGSRKVRRFTSADPVAAIYAYAEAVAGTMGEGTLELRYSFPPRNLIALKDKTVGAAKLHGENIQARFVP